MRAYLPLLSVLFLASACGGGSDTESSPVNSVVSNPPAATGEFRRAQDTGKFFGFSQSVNNENQFSFSFNNGATSCLSDNNNYYYETSNALIYGDSTLPDSDFERVASLIESEVNRLPSVLGFSNFDAIFEKRNDIAPAALDLVYSNYEFGEDRYTSIAYPDNFDERDSIEKSEWFAGYFRGLSKAEQNGIVIEIASDLGFTWEADDFRLNDKLLVCVNRNNSDNEYAHGGTYGVSVAAPSVFNRSDIAQVIRHELVHTVQRSVYDAYHNPNMIPRWFLEGQALVLAGQPIASSRSSAYKAPTFVTFSDETNVDFGEAYRQYGLAYKYLEDANNTPTLISLIANIDESDFNHPATSTFIEPNLLDEVSYNFSDGFSSHHPGFIQGFDMTNIVDANGSSLSLERFKRDYDLLVD